MSDARQLRGPALAEALRDSRARTLAWTTDLSDAEWRMPMQAGVNPIAWELAHIAWFAEFWVLRGPHRNDAQDRVIAERPARIAGPDHLFDSSRLAHAARWSAVLPSRSALQDTLAAQLEACLAVLPDDEQTPYFHRQIGRAHV